MGYTPGKTLVLLIATVKHFGDIMNIVQHLDIILKLPFLFTYLNHGFYMTSL